MLGMTPGKRAEDVTAERLEEIRSEHALPVIRFAARIGVTRQTYEHWQKGQTLKGEYLCAIAEEFGVTPGWILGVPGEPKYRKLDDKRSDAHREMEKTVESLRKALANIPREQVRAIRAALAALAD